MRPVLPLFLLIATVANAQVRPETAGPGFVPPVLKGIAGDGVRLNVKPIPFPAAEPAWIRVTTPRFTIVSGAGEERTIELARKLETLAGAVAQIHPRLASSSPRSTHIFLFPRRRDVQPYFDLLLNRDDAESTGVFVEQRDRGTMFIDASSARSERTPFHELIHYLLAGGRRPPLWIEEGLAEYFGSAHLREDRITVGRWLPEHAQLLERMKPIPLHEFFAAKRDSAWSAHPLFYAQSWLIVDWLIRLDRDAIYPLLIDLENGIAVETALRDRYGKTLSDVERVVGSVRRQRGASTTLEFRDRADGFGVETIAHAGLLYELGSFLAGIEEAASEAERHLDAALAANPSHARSLAAFGAMRARQMRYEESEAFFDRALASAPSDGEIRLAFAESLLRNESGPLAQTADPSFEDAPRFRRARALARQALQDGADAARCHGVVGASYIVESDPAPGIEPLEKAHALLPSRGDYALHLLALYMRTGQREKADAIFARLEKTAIAQLVFTARGIIVREELDRANQLVRAQKLDEAATVIRQLAEITPDAGARADLLRQADEIAKVAEVNRHITMYNRAVVEANSGNRRAALATLGELLEIANDPGVLRDARALQQRLRR